MTAAPQVKGSAVTCTANPNVVGMPRVMAPPETVTFGGPAHPPGRPNQLLHQLMQTPRLVC